MTPLSRRTILSAVPVVLATACTTSNTNGIASVTVDVAEVNAWGQAFANGALRISGLPGVMGTTVGATIAAVATTVKADLTTFVGVAGSSVTLSLNTSTAQAAVSSLLADGETLIRATNGITGLDSDTATTAQTYIAAISDLVAIFQAVLSPTMAAALAPKMTEAQAFAILGVK